MLTRTQLAPNRQIVHVGEIDFVAASAVGGGASGRIRGDNAPGVVKDDRAAAGGVQRTTGRGDGEEPIGVRATSGVLKRPTGQNKIRRGV